MMDEWQKRSKYFAIWPGCTFDAKFPNRPPHEITVNFLPVDELQALEETKTQSLIEYHRKYLTLSYPLTLRAAPANSNPAAAWSVGIQMAAIMPKASGSSAALAHAGRFAQDNGGCGFVLKPSHLRQYNDEDVDHGVLEKDRERQEKIDLRD